MPIGDGHAGMHEAIRGEMTAGLSDWPFDFARLRQLDAEIKVSTAGINAMGHEIGQHRLHDVSKGACSGALQLRLHRRLHQVIVRGTA